MTKSTSYQKSRLHYFLWTFVKKFQPNCYFCHKAFTKADIPTRGKDNITEHHIDGDHSNMEFSNRVLTHRSCHKKHHTKDNINRKKPRQGKGAILRIKMAKEKSK